MNIQYYQNEVTRLKLLPSSCIQHNDNNKNIDKIIIIIVVSVAVVGPLEKPGLQAMFESVH